MRRKADIIIIRGTPGSGKSQSAKSLAKYYPKGVRMEIDTIRQMVISVDWENQQEHIDMLQASTKIIIEFLQFGYSPVIVIDTFSGDKINQYLDTLHSLNNELSIKLFGLFTTDAELKRRLEIRTINEFKDFAICKKLNDDVLSFKHNTEHQIDTTGLLPQQTAEKIYRQINSQQPHLPE